MIDPSLYKIYYSSGNSQNSFFELNGINDVTIQKNLSYDNRFLLGGIDSAYSVNAPEEIEISIQRSFINYDNIFDYTGLDPIKELRVFNGNQFFSIENVYLKSYSASFSVGELPKIVTNFTSYGSQIKQLDFFDGGSVNSTALDIPKLNSISISGIYNQDIKNKYNVFSFDYELTINRQPYYSVGKFQPTEVCPILPLQIQASVRSKIPNGVSVLDIPSSDDSFKDFDIVVSGTSSLFKLPIRKSKLVSSNLTLNSQNTMEIQKQFLGYYGL